MLTVGKLAVPSLDITSRSRTFDKTSEQNWVDKLQEVHMYAWKQWEKYSAENSALTYYAGSCNCNCLTPWL